MLGLIPDADFLHAGGRLRPGDALMLYTDGMVETRGPTSASASTGCIGQADRKLREQLRRAARPRWSTPPATAATTGPCCCSWRD